METSHHPNALPHGYLLKTAENTYRIERVLGMGGFGITYLATTSVRFDNLKSRIFVAIKEHFISDSCERERQTQNIIYSNPVKDKVESSRKDFLAEARRLREVGTGHPNIVKVNGVFEANNTAYYVMEYLEGSSLRAYVKENGKLEEKEMLALMRPIIDAVDYLHKHRMTHLDIKPDNIMLATDEDDHVRPTLIDFGLSKHYGRDGKPTSTINTLGCSDGYAPIEQYGGITTFSPSADVYALGATMLFCLTGKDPKKSTEFLDDEKKRLLASLSLSDAMRDMLADTLLMNVAQRKFPTLGQAEIKEKDGNGTQVIKDKNWPNGGSKDSPRLLAALLGRHGSVRRKLFGNVTMALFLLLVLPLLLYDLIDLDYYEKYYWSVFAFSTSVTLLCSFCNVMNVRSARWWWWMLASGLLMFVGARLSYFFFQVIMVAWTIFPFITRLQFFRRCGKKINRAIWVISFLLGVCCVLGLCAMIIKAKI